MIARVWRGWTSRDNAEAYDRLLQETILPSFAAIDGYRGGMIYRGEEGEHGVEFVITNFFTSVEALQAFAGQDDYTVAVIEPEARELLGKVERVATHYDVRGTYLLDKPF